ncbi:MAG: 16S rRNA (cytidine(1402)-2'-O)-methyltransferase [Caulobacteraceae bacterium]
MAAPLPAPVLSTAPLAPGLYLVATPIGNLRDITLRALDVLGAADLVLAEDTRVTGKLLHAFGIKAKLRRYDDHASDADRADVIERLASGGRIALVSDAGSPLVSDPGFRLVRDAAAANVEVFAIPGASAAIAALNVAGLPSDRFMFVGFPPPKSAGRRAFFEELAGIRATLIFFEGVSRLGASLTDMAAVLGPRPAAVARELTKLHETTTRGTLSELASDPTLQAPKGEVVIVVGPGEAAVASETEIDAALAAAFKTSSISTAASDVAQALGIPRKEAYRRALALKGGG